MHVRGYSCVHVSDEATGDEDEGAATGDRRLGTERSRAGMLVAGGEAIGGRVKGKGKARGQRARQQSRPRHSYWVVLQRSVASLVG